MISKNLLDLRKMNGFSLFHFIHPEAGEVLFWGKNIRENEMEIKQRVGFVSGAVSYYPNKKLKSICFIRYHYICFRCIGGHMQLCSSFLC